MNIIVFFHVSAVLIFIGSGAQVETFTVSQLSVLFTLQQKTLKTADHQLHVAAFSSFR